MASMIPTKTYYTLRTTSGYSMVATIERNQYEAGARGSFYPATVTRTEWIAKLENGYIVGAFPSHKKALAALKAFDLTEYFNSK